MSTETTNDYVARMEDSLLAKLEPGQVWLVRSPRAITEPSFSLIGPCYREDDKRWLESPYDVLRTKFRFGRIPVRPHGGFAEADLITLGNLFQQLREQSPMNPHYWTRNLFVEDGRPLFYVKLFAFEAWD